MIFLAVSTKKHVQTAGYFDFSSNISKKSPAYIAIRWPDFAGDTSGNLTGLQESSEERWLQALCTQGYMVNFSESITFSEVKGSSFFMVRRLQGGSEKVLRKFPKLAKNGQK